MFVIVMTYNRLVRLKLAFQPGTQGTVAYSTIVKLIAFNDCV